MCSVCCYYVQRSRLMFGRFIGKVALVTAGGHGIGAATAKAFAREGASVVVVDFDEPAGREVVEGIRARGGRAEFCLADMTIEADASRMVSIAIAKYGALNIAVNVVGGMHREARGTQLHTQSF